MTEKMKRADKKQVEMMGIVEEVGWMDWKHGQSDIATHENNSLGESIYIYLDLVSGIAIRSQEWKYWMHVYGCPVENHEGQMSDMKFQM